MPPGEYNGPVGGGAQASPPPGQSTNYVQPGAYTTPGFGGLAPAYVGGVYGGAANLANQLSRQGASYQGRQATDLYNEGNTADVDVLRARENAGHYADQQRAAMGHFASLARGEGPSAAGIGMGGALNTGLANSYAVAHGGGSPGAGAAYAGGTPGQLSSIVAGGAGRGNEVFGARQAYMGATDTLAHGDLSTQGLDTNFAMKQADLATKQRTENDRMQLAYQGMSEEEIENQLSADSRMYGIDIGDQSNLGIVNYNNSNQLTRQLVGGALEAGGDAATAFAGLGRKPDPSPRPYSEDPEVDNVTASNEYNSDARNKYDIRPSLAEALCR